MFDIDVLLMGIVGAGFLATGGALIRSPAIERERFFARRATRAQEDAQANSQRAEAAIHVVELELARVRSELAHSQLKLSEGYAREEELARLKTLESRLTSEAQAARGDLASTRAELTAERELMGQLETQHEETLARLREAQEELRKLQAAPPPSAPPPSAPASVAPPPSAGPPRVAPGGANDLKSAEARLKLAEQRAVGAESKLKAAEARVKDLETRASGAESKLKAAEARASDAEGKLKAADTRAVGAETRLKAAEIRAFDAESKLKAAETRASDAETKLKAAPAPATADDAKLKAVEAKTRDLESRLKTSETRATGAEAKLKEHEAKLKVADSRTADLEARLKTAETRAADAETKLKAAPAAAADGDELETARNKIEALERMLEGSRARAKGLQAELNELKSKG